MAAVLSVMRQLHEMLRHLVEAEERVAGVTGDLRDRLGALVAGTPTELLALDLGGLRGEVGDVLARASARVRARWDGPGRPGPRRPGGAGPARRPTCGAPPCAGRC